MNDTLTRTERIIESAKSWLGTPFFPHGRVKGPNGGCSCQTLVAECYKEAGVFITDFVTPEAPLDWARANKESIIEKFADSMPQLRAVSDEPLPGDLIGFTVGGCVHHLGICIDGGEFIHCLKPYGVVSHRLDDATWLMRMARIWRPMASGGFVSPNAGPLEFHDDYVMPRTAVEAIGGKAGINLARLIP